MVDNNESIALAQNVTKLIEKYGLEKHSEDIFKDFWALDESKRADFLSSFDAKKYKSEPETEKTLGVSELGAEGEEKAPKEEEKKGLEIDQLNDNGNEKEPWSKWAENKGYNFEAKNQENPESDFEIKDKDGNQIVKMQKEGDKMSVASQKYEVYQKIVGDAQIDKYSFINVGENMSPEQSALLAAACLEKGMKFENGPKSIDLSMECLKDLPDEVKAKIAEYNEKGQPEQKKEATKENAAEPKEEEKKPEVSRHDKIAEIYRKKLDLLDKKSNLSPQEQKEYANIVDKLNAFEATGPVSGAVVADKIAEKKISGEIKGDINPEKGRGLSDKMKKEFMDKKTR